MLTPQAMIFTATIYRYLTATMGNVHNAHWWRSAGEPRTKYKQRRTIHDTQNEVRKNNAELRKLQRELKNAKNGSNEPPGTMSVEGALLTLLVFTCISSFESDRPGQGLMGSWNAKWLNALSDRERRQLKLGAGLTVSLFGRWWFRAGSLFQSNGCYDGTHMLSISPYTVEYFDEVPS